MKKKTKDLLIITGIYILAYAAGILACGPVMPLIAKCFVFDTVATVVTFVFSVILVNSSVYDAYWSLTPMVMALCLFIGNRAFSPYRMAFLAAFLLWSVRLTVNWISVFTGFDYEDWRYRKFRSETPKPLWPAVNFFGIHYVPTLVVFLGMLPIFEIVDRPLGPLSLPGIALIPAGVCLELCADRQMHAFWANGPQGTVCDRGLWKCSRHPNYLGEITVWLGVFLTMLPYAPERWYYGAGFAAVALMFETISIPLMEKRQLTRRPAYADYRKKTSRLLLLPVRSR